MQVNWFGDKFLEDMKQNELKRIRKACMFLENEVKKRLGRKCPPHSAPGDYPALETGELRRSITHEVIEDELTGRVGTNKVYGKYLEEGTTKMEARTFLANTLEANKGIIKDILAG
jgi:HK97 gp10 family phage protein